ncbi:MAG: hypothetical protein VX794_05900 [Nitrospinota bacterium]|nr:hypothetical protein [Nitrospinota bacterium]
MLTGCAPFFLIGIIGLAAGSWIFGTHIAARLTAVSFLLLFLLYFALLNWTARTRMNEKRRTNSENSIEDSSSTENELTTQEKEDWYNYLGSEGKFLWLGVFVLLVAFLTLLLRS